MSYPAVTTQPQPMGAPVKRRMWSSGTFSCFDDMGSCLLGTVCPVVLAMRVSGDMGESACVPCCVPGGVINLRTKLRTLNNIEGSIMDDCLISAFCGNCVVCQMSRELDYIKKVGSQ